MAKILFIHHCGSIGGAGISLLGVLDSIDKSKHDITVATKTSDSTFMLHEFSKINGIRTIDLHNEPAIYSLYSGNEKLWFDPWNIEVWTRIRKSEKALFNIITELDPDYIVVNSMCLFWVGKAFKSHRSKKICFVRETYVNNGYGLRNKMIQDSLKNDYYKAIYISKYDMERTGGNNGLVIRNMFIPSNQPISKNDARHTLNLSSNYKYVLFLGGNSMLKGVDVAVKSLLYLNQDYKLLILGCNQIFDASNAKNLRRFKPGSSINKQWRLQKFVEKNNLHSKILFMGKQKDIGSYMAASDVLIIPNTKPHQARPFFEAGFAQCPIIITDFECTKDSTFNGDNCLTFKNTSSKELANKIEELCTDDNLKQKLVINNYEFVSIAHNKDAIGKQVRDFFDQL